MNKKYINMPIEQYNLDGNLLKVWKDVYEVCSQLNLNCSNVIGCCNLKLKTTSGFQWKFQEDNYIKICKFKRTVCKRNKTPIIQMDLRGNYIREWNSVTEASKSTGYAISTISNCLTGNGKSNHTGEFTWKYKGGNYNE